MAKLSIVAGATSQSVNVFIQNNSVTTGAGLTGLVFNTSGLIAYYTFTGANTTATVISLVTLATVTTAYASGGFIEIDSTHTPGLYRLDLPNAVLATSKGRVVTVYLSGAANMAPCVLEIELTGVDNQDGVRMGMTALPNAAAAASGGLIINGSNSGTVTLAALTVSGATTLTGNLAAQAGVTITQSTSNAAGLSITGNGTGQGILSTGGATGPGAKFVGGATSGDGIDISTTSGDGLSILPTAGSAIVATANGTSKHGLIATGGTAGTSDGIKGVAGTGGVDLRANITGNITGNLSGSAGSVTGNVGGNVVGSVASVTGNVGGNVTGSVGSVGTGGISRASFTADSGLQSVRSGTCQAGSGSGTIVLDASASATNNLYQYELVYLTGGTGAGQAAYIASYVGSTQTATIQGSWITTPDATTTFAIIPRSQVIIGTNNDKSGYALSSTGFDAYADHAGFANGLTYRQNVKGIFLGLPLSKRSGLTNDGSAASILVRDVADTTNAISVSTDGHGNISTTPTFNL